MAARMTLPCQLHLFAQLCVGNPCNYVIYVVLWCLKRRSSNYLYESYIFI
jgi:hypothetical protein